MFCPVCKAEYRQGFTRCVDCKVGLVTSLRQEEVPKNPLELVWRGTDPVAFSRVIDALNEADIPHHVSFTHDHLVFGLGMPRPQYELRVFRSDLARAQPLTASIRDSLPYADAIAAMKAKERRAEGTGVPLDLSAVRFEGERDARIDYPLPEDARDLSAAHFAGSPEDWHPEKTVIEIWSGNDTALAGTVRKCLLEAGISYRTLRERSGLRRLWVAADDEQRAREIVRQIREGTPPE